MNPPMSKSFHAVLESTGTSLHWVIARIPVDLKKSWPEWRSRRVRGEINEFAFRTTLLPASDGGHLLLVNKKMQAGARVKTGDRVKIRLEPNLDVRIFVLPIELKNELKAERELQRWFDRLSPSIRNWIAYYIDQAKGAETRAVRAAKM